MNSPVVQLATPASATRVTNFAAMSAALTGFSLETISPDLDVTDLKSAYLQTADQNGESQEVDRLIAQFLSMKDKTSQEIADALLDTGKQPADLIAAARHILEMWYLGTWNGAVVSSNAYIGGLAWQAAQAHAMGYSEWEFGYWAQDPPPLADFGVQVSNGAKRG
jgi:hypothetical protein